ncbi:MAG: hypothetical protein GY772_30300 [bacterium]|nr:hypothetical protein [Deltaproteobacteria bacterium]MCP4244855.1 hypothetical protein [bacterium]
MAYSVSKLALNERSVSLAREVATDEIRVNTIASRPRPRRPCSGRTSISKRWAEPPTRVAAEKPTSEGGAISRATQSHPRAAACSKNERGSTAFSRSIGRCSTENIALAAASIPGSCGSSWA